MDLRAEQRRLDGAKYSCFYDRNNGDRGEELMRSLDFFFSLLFSVGTGAQPRRVLVEQLTLFLDLDDDSRATTPRI